MKVLIIPDVHQTTNGLRVIEEQINNIDKVVILGDMVDNWDAVKWWDTEKHNPIVILDKYAELVKKYPNKIHWLIGNHDLSYLANHRMDQSVSGHQWDHSVEIGDALRKYTDLMDIAIKLDGWVFSHAGFSDIWFKEMRDIYPVLTKSNLIEEANNSFHQQIKTTFGHLNFNHRSFNPSGDSPEEGPLWIRPNPLLAFATFKKQVVGHTECGPYYMEVKENDKLKEAIYVLDNAGHDCEAILDTKTNKIEMLKGSLHTQKLTWDEVKSLRKEYNKMAREKQKYAGLLNFF